MMPMERWRYPEDWERIAREVKDDAGWRCEQCGKQCRRPGEPFDTHKRTLTVSHINHDPADCRRENLRALCAPCHLRYDAEHHAETRRRRKLAGRGSVMADVRALSKLRDQYQEKADLYYESYQMDGRASAMRAYERNEALADALTDAMAAQDTKEQLIALKAMVMELRPDDERGDLALDVRRLQKRVSEGRL